ncbi:MAG: DUF2474 family protein [Alphaproteobacteria bacterium]|nr:DUF2474 family protein [Alphaproteobacteria bacterium]
MAKPADRSLRHRLLWFAGLWIAGVVCVGAVSYLIRLAMVG